MKKLILLLSIFLCAYSANAQNIKWAQSIYTSSGGHIRPMALDKSGNMVVSAVAYDTVDFNNNFHFKCIGPGETSYIANYNSDGICQWASLIELTNNSGTSGGSIGNLSINNIAFDSNSNVYVMGYFWGSKVTFNNGVEIIGVPKFYDTDESNYFIAKYNAQGNCLWAKRISYSSVNAFRTFSLESDRNGNIYISGNFDVDTLKLNNGIQLINKRNDWGGVDSKRLSGKI